MEPGRPRVPHRGGRLRPDLPPALPRRAVSRAAPGGRGAAAAPRLVRGAGGLLADDRRPGRDTRDRARHQEYREGQVRQRSLADDCGAAQGHAAREPAQRVDGLPDRDPRRPRRHERSLRALPDRRRHESVHDDVADQASPQLGAALRAALPHEPGAERGDHRGRGRGVAVDEAVPCVGGEPEGLPVPGELHRARAARRQVPVLRGAGERVVAERGDRGRGGDRPRQLPPEAGRSGESRRARARPRGERRGAAPRHPARRRSHPQRTARLPLPHACRFHVLDAVGAGERGRAGRPAAGRGLERPAAPHVAVDPGDRRRDRDHHHRGGAGALRVAPLAARGAVSRGADRRRVRRRVGGLQADHHGRARARADGRPRRSRLRLPGGGGVLQEHDGERPVQGRELRRLRRHHRLLGGLPNGSPRNDLQHVRAGHLGDPACLGRVPGRRVGHEAGRGGRHRDLAQARSRNRAQAGDRRRRGADRDLLHRGLAQARARHVSLHRLRWRGDRHLGPRRAPRGRVCWRRRRAPRRTCASWSMRPPTSR